MAISDAPATWSIKNVRAAVRQKAAIYAKRHGAHMAEWISLAVDAQADRQDGATVLPPERPGQPTAVQPASGLPLGSAAELMQGMAALAEAGLPVSKSAVRDVVATVRADIRAARGLPASRPRKTIGQTAAGRIGTTAVIQHQEPGAGPDADSAGSMPPDELEN